MGWGSGVDKRGNQGWPRALASGGHSLVAVSGLLADPEAREGQGRGSAGSPRERPSPLRVNLTGALERSSLSYLEHSGQQLERGIGKDTDAGKD